MVCDRCQYRSYPRWSPVVIVRVEQGDQLLLAHHRRATSPVYTVLAGFIEVGESAEDAVVREVLEESGITVGNVEYLGSQAWPFPGQLMLAYKAQYISGDLKPDRSELADVNWFSRNQLPECLPGEGTIAHEMIKSWLSADD